VPPETSEDPYEVLVIGGGPVGLYAALRGTFLHLRVHLVDKGRKWGRGFHVARYHNLPAHLSGTSGKDIISRLRKDLAERDLATRDDFVTVQGIERGDDSFKIDAEHHPTGTPRTYASRTVVLATGVVDRQPIIGGEMKNIFPHANKGIFCYCEICDGHLAKGKNVAVVGHGKQAAQKALTLTEFGSRKMTILTHGQELFGEDDEETRALRGELASQKVEVLDGTIASLFGAEEGFFGVRLQGGREIRYDLGFSGLGMYKINADLAIMLGGQTDEKGYVVVDGDCRVLDQEGVPIPGLYAIGDVNYNWNQLLIGFGDADRAIVHTWAEYL
jgi:thioredoxin reductase (NADPH)